MELRSSCKSLPWVTAFLLTVIVSQCSVLGGQSPSALQRTIQPAQPAGAQALERCLTVARDGNVKQALDMAKSARQTYRHERMFDVSYINTLVTIADETESRQDIKLLNEAIVVVNKSKQSQTYDGKGDPEVAYHFMQALGRLAELTESINPAVAAKIRIYEGLIATNLKANPNYPNNAVEALAKPMVSMARGQAARNDKQRAFAALRSAVAAGYGEFEKLEQREWLLKVATEEEIKSFKQELAATYQEAMKKWSRQVVSQFQPRTFNFDVLGIDGQRVSNHDFNGKVLVVDLWATWCPPCRKGIPHYIELQNKFRQQGVAVLGISMDQPTDPESAMGAVQQFAGDQEFNYPIAVGDQSIEGQLPEKMLLPTTLFFDRSGKVRFIARGYHDYAKIKAITEVLINESQPVGTSSSTFNF